MSPVRDAELGELLDRLVPPTAEPRDWERVVTDAAPRRARRRRPLVVALAAVLLFAAPLGALATTQGWWFSSGPPAPDGPVATVKEGTWDGVRWRLSAYRAHTGPRQQLCLGMSYSTTGEPEGTGSLGCGPTMSGYPAGEAIGFMGGHGPVLPDYVAGPVIETARTVELGFADGTTITVPTIDAPSGLDEPVAFYVTRLESRSTLRTFVARDESGAVVARRTRTASFADALGVRPGTPVRFSPAMVHRLRLSHRSTDVGLLATRAGRNFYRFGKHGCYGSGPALDPATLPPTRDGIRMLGGPQCGHSFPSPSRPVIDMSLYGQNRGEPKMTVLRLAGVASDAVRSVYLLDHDDRIIQRVPVIDNVFVLRRVPKGVVAVVPADADGTALARCQAGGYLTPIGIGPLTARC